MKRQLRSSVVVLAFAAVVVPPWIWVRVAQGRTPHHGTSCRCWRLDYLEERLPHGLPRGTGQDALGAVQEVVAYLLSDPSTDWSEVEIARLRRHLVDLNELMMRAEAREEAVDGGVRITVGGDGDAGAAARRVVPEHARHLQGFRGWEIAVDDGEGLVLKILSDDPEEAELIRALGFFGFLATGVHRPQGHLAAARGRPLSEPHWRSGGP